MKSLIWSIWTNFKNSIATIHMFLCRFLTFGKGCSRGRFVSTIVKEPSLFLISWSALALLPLTFPFPFLGTKRVCEDTFLPPPIARFNSSASNFQPSAIASAFFNPLRVLDTSPKPLATFVPPFTTLDTPAGTNGMTAAPASYPASIQYYFAISSTRRFALISSAILMVARLAILSARVFSGTRYKPRCSLLRKPFIRISRKMDSLPCAIFFVRKWTGLKSFFFITCFFMEAKNERQHRETNKRQICPKQTVTNP